MSSISLEQARALVESLENDHQEQAQSILNELLEAQEASIVKGLTNLTHDLHVTLDQLDDDSILMQTKHDIPDATERLEYVMQATEEASNNTLDKAEQALQNIEKIQSQLPDLDNKLDLNLELVKQNLTEIMLAQSFQDLTGQVLNRVILIISSLETSLMQLIEHSKYSFSDIPDRQEDVSQQYKEQMKGMGPNVTQKSKEGTLADQSDVDSLLDDLGI